MFLNKGRNLLINGALDHWQRAFSFVSPGAAVYTADRWQYQKIGTMTHTVTRDTDVPSFAQAGILLPYSMKLALTASQSVLGAGDYVQIAQKIEGSVFSVIAGKKFTLSFWVKAALVGTYSVTFRNATPNRTYVKSYTINQANTWEKKTITVQHDTTGTWDYSTGIGMYLTFTVAMGTNFYGADGVWSNGNLGSTSSQVNGVASAATSFFLAGIMLEEGAQPSNFERMAGNPVAELALCQRYFEKSYLPDVPVGTNTAANLYTTNLIKALANGAFMDDFCVWFKTLKRTAPATTVYHEDGTANSVNAGATKRTFTSGGSIHAMGPSQNNSGVALSQGTFVQFHWAADAEL